jgi:hypothetical protein
MRRLPYPSTLFRSALCSQIPKQPGQNYLWTEEERQTVSFTLNLELLRAAQAQRLAPRLPLFHAFKRQLLARHLRQGHLCHFFQRGQMSQIFEVE